MLRHREEDNSYTLEGLKCGACTDTEYMDGVKCIICQEKENPWITLEEYVPRDFRHWQKFHDELEERTPFMKHKIDRDLQIWMYRYQEIDLGMFIYKRFK